MAICVTYDKVWDQGYICRQWGIKVLTYDKVSDQGSFWRSALTSQFLRGQSLWPLKNWVVGHSDLSVSERLDAPSWRGQERPTSQFLRGWTLRPLSVWKVRALWPLSFLKVGALWPLSFFGDHSHRPLTDLVTKCQDSWFVSCKLIVRTKHGWLGSWYAYWVCIERSNLFYFDFYRPWIWAYSALAIGVEKDTIEENKAFGHMAKIWLSRTTILDWLPCEIGQLRNVASGHYN